jgi:hypothetical protein
MGDILPIPGAGVPEGFVARTQRYMVEGLTAGSVKG